MGGGVEVPECGAGDLFLHVVIIYSIPTNSTHGEVPRYGPPGIQTRLPTLRQGQQWQHQSRSTPLLIQEISTVFKELNIRLSGDEVEKIMDNFDANHDDSIQFEEFLLVLQA